MSTTPQLPFEQRPNSGVIVGLPVIILGVAAGILGFVISAHLLVFCGFATAGLGATAWVGLKDVAKSWAEHRERSARD